MENFNLFFDELCQDRGLLPATRLAYMEGLQPTVRQVRNAYQNDNIIVDYGHLDVQFVYMTRYFPFYTQLVRNELSGLLERNIPLPSFTNANPLSLSFFCCGPAPEAYGACRLLREIGIVDRTIQMNVFDLFAESWRAPRNVVINHIRNHLLPNSVINVTEYAFDLRVPIALEHLNAVADSNLIVFQNCLNEINDAGRLLVQASLLDILQRIRPGSIIVIFERSGYAPVLGYLNNLTTVFGANGCEVLSYGLAQPKRINNSGLKQAILRTECSGAYRSFESPMTGLVLSPDVYYWSLVVRKL